MRFTFKFLTYIFIILNISETNKDQTVSSTGTIWKPEQATEEGTRKDFQS